MDKIRISTVTKEIPADIETPVSAFHALKQGNPTGFLLESVEMGDRIGRYSFLGFEPELLFTARGKDVTIRFRGKTETRSSSNPLDDLQELIGNFTEEKTEGLPPFSSGLVGYFSYDCVRYFEKLPDTGKPDTLDLPDIHMVLPKILIAFDHIRQKLVLMCHAFGNEDRAQAEATLKKYEEKLYRAQPPARIVESRETKINMTSNTKKENFVEAIRKAKDHIVAGDIFQVVLSQRFRTETDLPPFDIYRKLRMINPSPYMYYFDFEGFQIIGTSPEVMVKRALDGAKDEIVIRPIAGTRPRGRTAAEDQAVERELLEDKKEMAEHTMLLDLARNDIGRMSDYGSVRVENPYHVERYSHVMHIVSDVTARPRTGIKAMDIVQAAFPAGTVSGAPKVRAMEIIENLEPDRRGIYAGAIGYADFRGNLDTCIAIRTIVYKDRTAYIQAGAGIVYDSVPEKEYEETINKAKALMKALV